MDTNSVKNSVIDSYGKLAKTRKFGLLSKVFACCNLEENAKAVAENIGYSNKEIQEVPADSNLGVGCGNPAAMTQINPGEVVVDLGSGAGFDAFIVSRMVGQQGQVIGVDLSDDMLALAKRNAKQGNYENVAFVKGDIEHLPLEEAIADHVISNCVINLSLRKDKVYEEAYRVLKPGGKLSVSDIVLEKELPDFIKKSLASHIACVSGAEKLEDYLGYVKGAGFSEVEVVKKGQFPLELIISDPQIQQVARALNFDLKGEEAKELASRVTSISLTAKK